MLLTERWSLFVNLLFSDLFQNFYNYKNIFMWCNKIVSEEYLGKNASILDSFPIFLLSFIYYWARTLSSSEVLTYIRSKIVILRYLFPAEFFKETFLMVCMFDKKWKVSLLWHVTFLFK